MPPLSTHFRFATAVLPLLGIVSHVSSFVLGTTAVDAFDPDSEDSFAEYHFREKNERISLENFLRETNFILQPVDDSSWSFSCGYYSHLWLDVFFRDNADCLPFRKPIRLSDVDLRMLVRRETEILNVPFVLHFESLPFPEPEHLCLPLGLEFVDRVRCIHLFHEVIKQSQAWSQLAPGFEAIDEAGYTAFFGDVAKIFTNEFQKAA
jgi:hypothetical protein